jgi:hypothetical protein
MPTQTLFLLLMSEVSPLDREGRRKFRGVDSLLLGSETVLVQLRARENEAPLPFLAVERLGGLKYHAKCVAAFGA